MTWSWNVPRVGYNQSMNEKDNEHLERHLELCRRVFLRMMAEGTWPWKEDDSQESENVVESEDNDKDE